MIRMTRQFTPVILACFLSTLGFAADEDSFTAIPMHMHIFQVRPEISQFEYHEPGLMKEKGTFYGIGGSYTYRPWADPNNITTEGLYMLRVEGRYSAGEMDYHGSLWDGTPYSLNDVDDKLAELRVLGGRDFLTSNSLTTLYFGFGYRYLSDDSSFDPVGYKRESNYFYVPAGLQHTFGLGGGWSLTPGGEFDFLFLGQQARLSAT